ncbi:hypothetical protein HJG60_012086 [Phyllostomus discolor]|uniref:Uncharacterized protein n=1 Tax=Phyllostomus discolor TaxID=89673 RepID=A0A833ZM54_9CHIR|nr:hypothetical protein HJG60_012086 [Phyllostomus discolor]
MLPLFAQHKKELQLNIKTNNTQNCQKIELYGSLTTKDLKKSPSSRWVGGAEMETRWRGEEVWREVVRQWWQWNAHGESLIHVWWIKICQDTLGVSDPSPRPDCIVQYSSTRKMNLHNSGCKNQWGLKQWENTARFSENFT